jgi:hypothetical protein
VERVERAEKDGEGKRKGGREDEGEGRQEGQTGCGNGGQWQVLFSARFEFRTMIHLERARH